MHKPFHTLNLTLLAAALTGAAYVGVPTTAHAETTVVQQQNTLKGIVKDKNGEPAIGATVLVVGTRNLTTTNIDGTFTLKNVPEGATIRVSLIGYNRQDVKWKGGSLSVVLEESGKSLNEVVVTAMGIMRKEKSLTYATQQIKSDDLNKVQDINLVNGLEGKAAGVTITPSAGGAGGASKIQLRGAQSILGNNSPLIVVDGVPMSNDTRSQASSAENLTYSSVTEGSDPLSMFNPDDIENVQVLKGANAAALYGSRAANGVIMITTKKGREGRVDVSFTSNITFDTPLTKPKLQNTYGATVSDGGGLSIDSWGPRISDRADADLVISAPMGKNFTGTSRDVHLRNKAADDVSDFYRTGVTTNNSISLSGGTEKVKTYFSFANSHSNGMIESNTYNRNTLAFRQTYNLFKRVHIEASINYMQTKTKNRTGGGTVLNPIYDLYTMPRNIDLAYYRENYTQQGEWIAPNQQIYQLDPSTGGYKYAIVDAPLSGLSQQWAYQAAGQNNPYWLLRQNRSVQKEDRVFGYVSGKVDIYDGLAFQARVSIDHTKFDGDSRRYATTQGPNAKDDFGHYWKDIYKTDEIYTDYLLSYNKTLHDFSLSATAGWVGHVTKNSTQKTDVSATYIDARLLKLPTTINQFTTSAGGVGATSLSLTNDWDKAALFTAQVGWKDIVFIDGSYRRDWYFAFRQFKDRGTSDNYGYFSFGGSAILSQLLKMPAWVNYLKYRISYSEVGNSIPNRFYSTYRSNFSSGAANVSSYLILHPEPEKTKSFEMGLESQFLDNRLGIDLTFYNTGMHNSYLERSVAGKTEALNSGFIRNRGFEATVSYNFSFGDDWRWRTSLNASYNKNKIVKTVRNDDGTEALIATDVAQGAVRVRYNEGGKYGDMYVTDFKRYTEDAPDGSYKKGWIVTNEDGTPRMDDTTEGRYATYAGNMNADWQLGWSNTISYKNFQLFFLINGRIGGKVVSLTESYLDNLGVSERVGKARDYAQAHNLYMPDGSEAMYLPDGSGRLVGVKSYYKSTSTVGSGLYAPQYIYNATNFRLRELSLGYTFRNLLGENKNLTLSFIGRNLFFIYKDAPVDPDVSLSTANGLGAFEIFNLPSARSYGFSLKLNF